MQRNSKIDERGATAIEYAIIAGLIGLGLVGSLVTTRGSLSSVFGTAASQISSGPDSASQPAQSRADYWSSKGLISKTTSGNSTTWNYNDGSKVILALGDPSYPVRYVYTDAATMKKTTLFYDTDNLLGVAQTIICRDIQCTKNDTVTKMESMKNGVIQTVRVEKYGTTNNLLSSTVEAPSAEYLKDIQQGQSDQVLFSK